MRYDDLTRASDLTKELYEVDAIIRLVDAARNVDVTFDPGTYGSTYASSVLMKLGAPESLVRDAVKTCLRIAAVHRRQRLCEELLAIGVEDLPAAPELTMEGAP